MGTRMSANLKDAPHIDLYVRFMEGIKWRLLTDCIPTRRSVAGNRDYLPNLAAAEFCLLQLRKSCELLALGCVAMHQDARQTRKLRTEWNAHRIMGIFGELKPSFFPMPSRTEIIPGASRPAGDVQPIKDALTKKEMLKAYHIFGRLLHSGTFEDYTTPQREVYDFSLIDNFVVKMMKLTNDHLYSLHDGKVVVRVFMQCPQIGGHVAWQFWPPLPPGFAQLFSS